MLVAMMLNIKNELMAVVVDKPVPKTTMNRNCSIGAMQSRFTAENEHGKNKDVGLSAFQNATKA